MKKIYVTILLIVFAVSFASAQQPFTNLNGYVINKETGAPVAGQTMLIMLDSLNSGYNNKAVTDEKGFYFFYVPFITDTTKVSFTVYTYDCNGSIVSGSGKYIPGNGVITINFSICGVSDNQCKAFFKYLPNQNNGLDISFYDGSQYFTGSGNIKYIWNFGDSTSSSLQNPIHTYTKPGVYNVCLSISSSANLCSSSICLPVTVGSWNSDPCENYFVYHADSTTNEYIFEGFVMNGPADTWDWDFGDGTAGKGQKVSHSYAAINATYTVCLTTSGAGTNGTTCTSHSCQEVYKYVPSPCESAFWYYPDSSGSGYTFEGYAKNSQINSWKWDFGDGNTATGQRVSHTFTGQNNTFTVCLNTSGSGADGVACTFSYCQDVFYSLPSPCENSFGFQADSLSLTYTFHGWSKNGQVSSWNWNFGDGTSASGQTVTHSFADKNTNYTVCLTTITGLNSDSTACTYSSCQDVYVYWPSLCESSFQYYPDSTGLGFTFEGYAKSNQVISWSWDFGDGTKASGQKVSHSFNFSPGSTGGYQVCLTTTGISADGDSCTFSSCQEIFIYSPSPCENYFKAYTLDGATYTFSGTVASGAPANYYWDFGDGTSASGQIATHTFGNTSPTPVPYTSAAFNVCLTTIANDPTINDTCKSISCQLIFIGADSSMCKALFSAVPDSSGKTYRFQNQSQKKYSYAFWDFGDGEKSFDVDAEHTYSSPGIYIACLTVIDSIANCKDQACQEIWIDVIQPDCLASFTVVEAADSSNIKSLGYLFSNTSASRYTNQEWSFGDGIVSNEQNPVHFYDLPGVYNTCLTIWDSLGKCQDTYCMNLFVGKVINDNTVAGIVLAGNKVADHGIVWLVSPDNSYNAELPIDSTGIYHFTGVPYGQYYIYAMLTPGSHEFFSYMPTYYASSISWQGATLIFTGEPNAWYAVNLVPSMAWSQGDATITGTINWGGMTLKAENNPVANVEVVLYNSAGDPIAYTFTDNDGTYIFEHLPYGDYTLQAEMTGKSSQLIAVNLNENSANANVSFAVNGAAIDMLGITEQGKTKLFAGNPYPNPACEILNITMNVPASETIEAEIVDLQGRVIHSEAIALSGGNNLITISTGSLTKGIYILKIKSDGYRPVQRKFIK